MKQRKKVLRRVRREIEIGQISEHGKTGKSFAVSHFLEHKKVPALIDHFTAVFPGKIFFIIVLLKLAPFKGKRGVQD